MTYTAFFGEHRVASGQLRHMLEKLSGIHERRPVLAARPDTVWDVLIDGSKKARAVAEATMEEVRSAMKIRYDRT